jgi:steroid 5-alpha reductase family enzyme
MNRFAAGAFWQTLPFVAAAILAVLAVSYLAGRIVGKHSVIDTAWGLLFGASAVVAFAASAGSGEFARRALLLGMTLIWGLRLAVRIGRRNHGKPEDPRYQRALAGRSAGYALAMVYGLQGLLAFVIAMPLVVGSFTAGRVTPLGWLGVLVWLVGLYFEAVGDWQLDRYRAQPERAEVLDYGLWRYTRHPNYFGDACIWIGIFLLAAERWPGVLTVFSPVIMVYLLAFGSGKPMLERSMAERPAYREYMRRTSGFLPLPPESYQAVAARWQRALARGRRT